MPPLSARDVTFLKLQPAVLCIECELISYNNTDHCLACGSRAVMSLSRVLGGSLKTAEASAPVSAEDLQRAIATVLLPSAAQHSPALPQPAYVRDTAMAVIGHTCRYTGAEGAALALQHQGQVVCAARAGRMAPDLGVALQPESGISGLCLRTGRAWRCDDVERNPHVDLKKCRALGVRSLVVAPVAHLNHILGVLEVMSSKPRAFDHEHVATVQLMSDLFVLSLVRTRTAFLRSSAAAGQLASA